jgi:D-alanyl-D-alanine carboxypeptidase/D-alanyl-D-alanine-endopeptidase (penicillin-binding protein 4)
MGANDGDPRPTGGGRPYSEPPLAEVFREWSADPALAGALVAFCLLHEDGHPLFASPLADSALCPASSLKTVTTAAALEILGPDFHFDTLLLSDAEISPAGVIDGNLQLLGSGDPTLSSSDLEGLVDEVIKAGLKQINGTLQIDGADFREPPANDHWNWGDLGNAYGAGAYGFNLDHNRIVLRFRPGAGEGEPASLLNPKVATQDTRWINEVFTGPPGTGDRVVVYSEPYGRTIRLRGSVPLGEGDFPVNAALPDPPARVRELLEARLAAAGVRTLGRAVPVQSGMVIHATHESAKLPEIIDHLHKVSDNLEAQCLFLTLGSQNRTDPDAAYTLVKHWQSRGVNFTGLRLIDGSGLARANMIRPLDLARVNHLARRGPHGERFRQSLTSYLGGKVRSKLGAMSGVKTEVGFLTLDDGREVTFALMANGLGLDVDFWPLREKLLRGVASKLTR